MVRGTVLSPPKSEKEVNRKTGGEKEEERRKRNGE